MACFLDSYFLNEDQKRALIFIKEVGAIDNSSNRQLNAIDVLKASFDLRFLREKEILEQKGKGKSTYYIPGPLFTKHSVEGSLGTPVMGPSAPLLDLSAPADPDSKESHSTLPIEDFKSLHKELIKELPATLLARIDFLHERINDKKVLEQLVIDLCDWKPLEL